MSAASWFRLSKRALHAVLSQSARRKPPRQPTYSRPSLECLEERVVPATASNNQVGVINNATTFTAFNTQQSSIILPNNPSTTAQLSGLAVGVFPNAGSPNALGLAVAAFASPLVQGQLYGQFSILGINAVGQQGLGFPNNTPNFLQNAQGFGSGSQPGQPWVPNAYNLGLANQQGAYPTLADRGFQAPPPWVRQIAHLQEKNPDTDLDEQVAPSRAFLVAKESAEDDDQAAEISADEDAGDPWEERIDPDSDSALPIIPLVPHAATETNDAKAVADAQARATKPATLEATPFWHVRGEDAMIDEARLAGKLEAPEAAVAQESGAPEATLTVWTDEQLFHENDGPQEVPALESLNLPSVLLLSVLTPAQMMGLLADFPVEDASAKANEEECLASLGEEE